VDDHGLGLRPVGLVLVLRDPVVADERVGEDQYLPLVAGVRDGLRIADDGGREDDLADSRLLCAERPAF
jgi:hypothetical protein